MARYALIATSGRYSDTTVLLFPAPTREDAEDIARRLEEWRALNWEDWDYYSEPPPPEFAECVAFLQGPLNPDGCTDHERVGWFMDCLDFSTSVVDLGAPVKVR